MINRYINIKKDFHAQNELANKINPIIRSAKFKNEQEKQLVLDYVHKIFFNQWRKNDKK